MSGIAGFVPTPKPFGKVKCFQIIAGGRCWSQLFAGNANAFHKELSKRLSDLAARLVNIFVHIKVTKSDFTVCNSGFGLPQLLF